VLRLIRVRLLGRGTVLISSHEHLRVEV
jgi:hypothetical protein